MPTLLEYINQLQREHRFRIKMVFQPTDRQLEVLERHMKKYDALEVGRPEKLMLQAIPMDFPGYGGHEVVLVDVVTRLPLSPAVLEAELRSLLSASEGTVRVIGRDEPREQEAEKEASDKPYEVKVGADYTEAEANAVSADQATGDKFNQSMLKDLDKARAEAKANIVKAEAKSDAKMSDPTWEGPEDGKISPVGTRQNTIPTNPRKGAK